MPALYTHTTRASGIILTAAIYNGDHENHITNGVPLQLDDYSVDVTEMRVTTDPGEAGTESLATTLGGELARIRFTIKEMKKWLNGAVDVAQWYTTASGSVAGTVADGTITMAKLADLAGLSLIGRSANTTGVPAAITAASDGHILRRSGTSIGFGTIPNTSITGLGTAATMNTGTSGNVVPKLNTANTWSEDQTFDVNTQIAFNEQDSNLTGSQSSFSATGVAVTFSGGSPVTLQGISGGASGRVLIIYGTADGVTFKHESGGASAANRISCVADFSIGVGEVALLVYSPSLSRWVAGKLLAGVEP